MPSQQDLEGCKHVCSAAVTRRSTVWRGLRSGQAPRPAITIINSESQVPEALQCVVSHRAASRCGSTAASYGSSSSSMLLAKEALVMHHRPCRSVGTCYGVIASGVCPCALAHCHHGCMLCELFEPAVADHLEVTTCFVRLTRLSTLSGSESALRLLLAGISATSHSGAATRPTPSACTNSAAQRQHAGAPAVVGRARQ